MKQNLDELWGEVKSLHSRGMYSTMSSEYWIEQGVIIEKHLNKVELKVCLHPGDNFTEPTHVQDSVFKEFGWDAGVCKVNMDYLKGVVDMSIKRSENATNEDDIDRALAKAHKNELSYQEFRIKFEKILQEQE